MAKKYKFLLSDESLNCYGCRIITAGINLDNFQKNPIMLWNHTRAWTDKDDQVLPIGYWENLYVEDGKLYGEAIFDQKDEFAQKIESKVEQKVIRCCSVSVGITATSADKAHLIQGQTRPTIIGCELREVSIVDIPGNANAVKLYDAGDGSEINLSDNGERNPYLPLISTINTEMNMELREQMAVALELKSGSGDSEIIDAITALMSNRINYVELTAERDKYKKEVQSFREAQEAAIKTELTTYVDEAITLRKITASERDTYISLAEKDFDAVKKILDAREGVEEPQDGGGDGMKLNDPWEERKDEIRKSNK
jgi:hypothetical protein